MKKRLLQLLFLLTLASASAYAQTVTGTVTAAGDGTPVPGVSVLLKGSSSGTTTDSEGKFTLTVPDPQNSVLVLSFIGFATQEVTVGNQTTLNIVLKEDATELSEVVVTALGVERETKTLAYATQAVKPSQLTEVRDANNVINSLQGKIANATITQGSGGPGSGAKIVLRGNRSIQGNNNALIVVDGVPINNNTPSTAGSDFGSVQGSDGASNLNPDDIESMTVLRGAAAAALYGSQAGNGVIVITTKKGKADQVSVDINSGVTAEKVFILPQFQNSYGQGNGGVMDPTSGESWGARMTGQSYTNYLGQARTYSAEPDNVKDFFRTGTSLNNSIGIRAGTQKVQTYLSYTNNFVQGIIPKNELHRHTINLRLTSEVSKRLSFDTKITYISQQINNRPRTGEENSPVMDVYQMPRNVSNSDARNSETRDAFDVPTPTAWPSTLNSIYQNPYWMINRTAINENRDRVMGFITAKFKFTDWLNIQGRANLDKSLDTHEEIYSANTLLWASNPGGYYSFTNGNTTQKWFDVMLTGDNKLSDQFSINYRVGAIYQDNSIGNKYAVANGLNVTNKFNIGYGTSPQTSEDLTHTRVNAGFAQATVDFKDAIFLEGSYRVDYASTLPSPYRYSYYSVGTSAVISDLITVPEPLSFLKASITYAQVGNGGQAQLRDLYYFYNQGAGRGLINRGTTQPLPNLKPEIVKNLEFGIEAKFLENRIGFTATYYKSNSTNQLLTLALPVATGYASKYLNAGDIQNKGFELVVTGSPLAGRALNWDVTFNLGMNRNKIVSLDKDIKETPLGGGYGRSATPIVKEGGRYGDLTSFKWQRDASGNFMVIADGEKNAGTPVISKDQEYIGNFNPRATLGLTNTFEYKRFSLRILADGRAGGIIVSGDEMNLAFSGITKATEQYREGGWNLGGVDASGNHVAANITAQQFWQVASGKRYGNAEFFAYDATNFRVRELSIGYSIPVPSGSFIKAAKFSFVARNLFWLYRGSSLLDVPGLGKRKMSFDPDMALGNGNYQGIQYGTLPSTRSIGCNLKLTF
ncbi:TonB-linked outer membrane protein, SusC/RagA family [Chryseolinea serpens]|uniref:TonB-linked outer membrane protein, SusC/RagA family n=1 Tax=Chryseolinea serpens TaxID=947013 RepID=A0A1M5N7B0_9BACT|nr:SusC/RagA family TonB-linked outer membrane protein [Chryseolinea serpens]SHG85408.1 TonB-linked outer membrane protein, SusC/RagA family [Chryseolinea serpens]